MHDTVDYAPVLRTGEFVIVLPDADRAAIEVKKTLTSGSLKKALLNLAATRDFLWKTGCSGTNRFFTALFTFDTDDGLCPVDGKLSDTYKNRIQEMCEAFPPGIAVPDLIMSALHLFIRPEPWRRDALPNSLFWTPAKDKDVNISGQMLVYHLMQKLDVPEMLARVRRFRVPSDWPAGGFFQFKDPESLKTSIALDEPG